MEYYQPYFDVDTKTVRSLLISPLTFVGFWLNTRQQVLRRCYTTLNPLSAPTYTSTHLNPADLYGPFWTLTTLIFALYLSSSLGASIAAYLSAKGAEYDYDFQLLSVAVSLVYAYGLGVPVLLWLGLRYLGVGEWSVVEAISVWGYGQFVWIPVSVRTTSLFSWGADSMISRDRCYVSSPFPSCDGHSSESHSVSQDTS